MSHKNKRRLNMSGLKSWNIQQFSDALNWLFNKMDVMTVTSGEPIFFFTSINSSIGTDRLFESTVRTQIRH